MDKYKFNYSNNAEHFLINESEKRLLEIKNSGASEEVLGRYASMLIELCNRKVSLKYYDVVEETNKLYCKMNEYAKEIYDYIQDASNYFMECILLQLNEELAASNEYDEVYEHMERFSDDIAYALEHQDDYEFYFCELILCLKVCGNKELEDSSKLFDGIFEIYCSLDDVDEALSYSNVVEAVEKYSKALKLYQESIDKEKIDEEFLASSQKVIKGIYALLDCRSSLEKWISKVN